MSYYDVPQVEQYIRQAARQRGMDPDIAVRVARSEGLGEGIWQSNERNKSGVREPSYGPFQLLVGGKGTGYGKGVGNNMLKQTGLDPRDPANVFASVDFALDTAAKDGWRQWYGAAKVGVGRWDGIRGDGRDNARATGIAQNHPTNNVTPAQYASLSSQSDVPMPPPRPDALPGDRANVPQPPSRPGHTLPAQEYTPYWEYLPMDAGIAPPSSSRSGFLPNTSRKPNPSTMQTQANPTGVAHGFSAAALNHAAGEVDAMAEQQMRGSSASPPMPPPRPAGIGIPQPPPRPPGIGFQPPTPPPRPDGIGIPMPPPRPNRNNPASTAQVEDILRRYLG